MADALAEVSMEFREWADPFRRPSGGAKWKQPHLLEIRDSECMSNTQMKVLDLKNYLLELSKVLATFSRQLRVCETFNHIHRCLGS